MKRNLVFGAASLAVGFVAGQNFKLSCEPELLMVGDKFEFALPTTGTTIVGLTCPQACVPVPGQTVLIPSPAYSFTESEEAESPAAFSFEVMPSAEDIEKLEAEGDLPVENAFDAVQLEPELSN